MQEKTPSSTPATGSTKPGNIPASLKEALHRIADHAEMVVWMADSEVKLTYLNPEAAALVGDYRSLNAAIWRELVHPDDLDVYDRIIAEMASQREVQGEYRVMRSDGSVRWLMATSAPCFSVDGKITGYTGSLVDVSDRHRLLDEIRKSKDKFRSLTAMSSDWYWETDENDRFTFVAPTVHDVLGVEPAQIIGKSRLQLVADPKHPAFLEYQRKVAARERFSNLQAPYLVPGKDMVRHIRISGEPVFEQGEFKGFRGVGQNVTNEVLTLQKNAELAAENSAIIANSLDIIALLDKDGYLLRINSAVEDILGYKPGELIGQPFLQHASPEDVERTAQAVHDLCTGKAGLKDFENHFVHKNGSLVRLSWSARWRASNGTMYAIARDITERYSSRVALQESKDRLHAMLEQIGDAFYVIDHGWRFTYANEKALAFLGLSGQDIVGRAMEDVQPQFYASAACGPLREAMESGETRIFETYYEPLSRWVEMRAYPGHNSLSVFFRDMTAEHVADEVARQTEQQLQEMIEMTPAGYLLVDGRANILDANPAFSAMTGYAREELSGRSMLDIFPEYPCNGALFKQHGAVQVTGNESLVRHKDGHLVHILVNASIRRDKEGHATQMTAFLTDISERRASTERLQHMATHDALTGLPNRTFLIERLQTILDTAPRKETNAVLFIDLDRFKEVNDSLGHEAGDLLLQEVARRLKSSLRPGDIVARLGGDEFVVIAHCARGAESAARIAEKLCAAVAAPVDVLGTKVMVGASIGISLFPQDGDTGKQLFQHADTAMYKVKMSGRNGYRFFTEAMSTEARTRMKLESALRHALERREFELHYQPRLEMKTGRVVGMEALIRWNHPEFGMVFPLQFIPIAEETGLITVIGEWVLQQACRETRYLMGKFGRPLRVSVNLSAKQLKCDNLHAQVRSALTQAGLPPYLLELELTESALVEDIRASAEVLAQLRNAGIKLSVDDFGTGYSSLAYLRHFPLDTLKLDQSFLKTSNDGYESARFIKAFVDMAHTLDLSVVAEGIETEDAAQFLREIHCDEGQGYLFAKPLPLQELEIFLARHAATRASEKAA